MAEAMSNGGGPWVRWALGVAVVAAVGSMGFVVQLAVGQGQLQQRQIDQERRSDEQRQQLRDEMIYRFNHVDQQFEDLRQRDHTRDTSSGKLPLSEHVPAFPNRYNR